jgi:Protein of unknown function (DUF1064)
VSAKSWRHWLPERESKPRKYLNDPRATAIGVPGMFDSRKESRRAQQLMLLEHAGEIQRLARQVRFELIPACGSELPAFYTADFTYYELREGSLHYVVEDCKSEPTRKLAAYVLRRKLMNWRHGIRIREV